MLVVSRKKGESVVVGDNIKITVCLIDGNKVRLGIEAPAEVKIRRPENMVAGEEASPKSQSPAGRR